MYDLDIAALMGFLSQSAVEEQHNELKELHCKVEKDVISIYLLEDLRLVFLC